MQTEENTILKIKDIARTAIPKGSKAILYGLRARGDARNDSDWDIPALRMIRTEATDEHLVRFFFKTAIRRMQDELRLKEANTTRFVNFIF